MSKTRKRVTTAKDYNKLIKGMPGYSQTNGKKPIPEKEKLSSPPPKGKGGDEKRDAYQATKEEYEAMPLEEQIKLHHQALGYLLHVWEEAKDAIKDHTKILNNILQKISEKDETL